MANRAEITRTIIETVAEVGGGAAAGYLDTKYADKKVGGLNLGTVLAIVGVGVGVTGIGGKKISHYAREIGGGAAAFELGKLVAEKTAKSMSQSSGSSLALRSGRVAGVGALPSSSRVVNSQQFANSLASLANAS